LLHVRHFDAADSVVNGSIKFQARISQAKMPIPKGTADCEPAPS